MPPSLQDLRRMAIRGSLFAPSTLKAVIHRLGFLQADPIRAPARAQDLVLRHRVRGYRAGDLERRYADLGIEEDFFINYGFMPSRVQALMHPRRPRESWSKARGKRADEVQAFVHERGVAHPREVDAHFAHGKVRNWFGGTSNSTTQLLDEMHYRGMLRVARRESGIRAYSVREPTPPPADAKAAHDALVDIVVAKYAPLPAATLGQLMSLMTRGVPQWHGQRAAALLRARRRLVQVNVDGVAWYLPADASLRPRRTPVEDRVWLLAPFDPVVWDRRRFEMFWGWAYRFEAYTPAPKRRLGYYALPMLWRDQAIGWANLSMRDGRLSADVGFVAGRPPADVVFRRELEAELERIRCFLQASDAAS